jgi:FtsZ-interacting cell division protein YlmF
MDIENVTVATGDAVQPQTNAGWDEHIEAVGSTESDVPEAETPEQEPVKQEEEQPKPKPRPKGYLKKLGKAEAEIEFLREQLKQYQTPKQEEKPKELVEPSINDYQTYAEFTDAQRRYDRELAKQEAQGLVKGELEALGKKAEEQHRAQTLAQKGQEFDQLLQEREATNPGIVQKLDEIIQEGLISKPIAELIVQSPKSIELAEYFADNKADLMALGQMNPMQQQMAMAFIQGKLSTAQQAAPEARQTKAPAPITPLGSPKVRPTIDKNTDFNKMSQEDFEREFNCQSGRSRPRR